MFSLDPLHHLVVADVQLHAVILRLCILREDGGTTRAGQNTSFFLNHSGEKYCSLRRVLRRLIQFIVRNAAERGEGAQTAELCWQTTTKIKTKTHKQSAHSTQSEVEIQTIHTKEKLGHLWLI